MPENKVDTEEVDLSLDGLLFTSFEHLDPAMPEAVTKLHEQHISFFMA